MVTGRDIIFFKRLLINAWALAVACHNALKKTCCTWYSHIVPDHIIDHAITSLASKIGRVSGAAFSSVDGRKLNLWCEYAISVQFIPLILFMTTKLLLRLISIFIYIYYIIYNNGEIISGFLLTNYYHVPNASHSHIH